MNAEKLNAAMRRVHEQHARQLKTAMDRYQKYLDQQIELFERETMRAEAELEKQLEQFTKLF